MFWNWNKKPEAKEEKKQSVGFFSTDIITRLPTRGTYEAAFKNTFQRPMSDVKASRINADGTVTVTDGQCNLKATFNSYNAGLPYAQLAWYGNQGFIGYQACATMAQNWLVDKACTMPARDAVRVGYTVTVLDGAEVKPEVLDAIAQADKKFRLNYNLTQAIRFSRIFGIRVIMFMVDSMDPRYYELPFNPDGITPGSYRGISQIDPYWIAPDFDDKAASDPAAIDFYEPTWWIINGMRVHKSHLIVIRPNEVADVLKPSYLFGGISIPQKIFERVYAAERTANEAPMLAMTKRLITYKADLTKAIGNMSAITEKLEQWTAFMSNFGVKIIGEDESVEQHDVSLADLDAVIMTQFQLVAAASEIPATKLLGTTPKGFNATGEYEEASYHELLESLQENDLTPLIERHHMFVVRSELPVVLGKTFKPFNTGVQWGSLDSMTAEEQANVNKIKAETDQAYVNAGAIDGMDVRKRIIADPDSGYNGLPNEPEGGFVEEETEGEYGENSEAE